MRKICLMKAHFSFAIPFYFTMHSICKMVESFPCRMQEFCQKNSTNESSLNKLGILSKKVVFFRKIFFAFMELFYFLRKSTIQINNLMGSCVSHTSPGTTILFLNKTFLIILFLVGAFLEKRVDYSHGFSSVF